MSLYLHRLLRVTSVFDPVKARLCFGPWGSFDPEAASRVFGIVDTNDARLRCKCIWNLYQEVCLCG